MLDLCSATWNETVKRAIVEQNPMFVTIAGSTLRRVHIDLNYYRSVEWLTAA
jgi:hypothetical protein